MNWGGIRICVILLIDYMIDFVEVGMMIIMMKILVYYIIINV